MFALSQSVRCGRSLKATRPLRRRVIAKFLNIDDTLFVEELPREVELLLEAYREAKRPQIKIGYIRVKRVVGVFYGVEGEDKT